MVNHSLIKLVLFMAAGVIFFNIHELDLNKVRGYGRKKPLLKGIFLIGALAIGGVPLSAGYVSKTLLHESILEYGGGTLFTAVEWLFLVSGGLTVAYMTKLFVAVFVEKNRDDLRQAAYDEKRPYMNRVTGFALTFSAAALLLWGLLPGLTMEPVARLGQTFMGVKRGGEAVAYFNPENLSGGAVSIGIGILVYLAVIRGLLMKAPAAVARQGGIRVFLKWRIPADYVNPWPVWLDILPPGGTPAFPGTVAQPLDTVEQVSQRRCHHISFRPAIVLSGSGFDAGVYPAPIDLQPPAGHGDTAPAPGRILPGCIYGHGIH